MPADFLSSNAAAINPVPEIAPDHLYGILVCPRCKEMYLHHGAVTTYDRPEDGDFTRQVTVTPSVILANAVPSPQSRNPSTRRNGIAIQFECEACGPLELTISQHKGQTHMEWRAAP